MFNPAIAQSNFNTVNTILAPYLVQPGNANINAGEFGTAAVDLQMTQDSQLTYFSSFTQEEAWARVKELLSIPTSAQVLWSKASTQYGNTGSIRYLYSYVIQQTSGVQKQIFFATEYLTTGDGWRKVYLVNKDYPLHFDDPFDPTCEYRYKRNFDPTSLGLSNSSKGDYWFYASAVFTNNIYDISHGGKISHIYATSKNIYRINGTSYSPGVTISQMQKRCDLWSDIDIDSSANFNHFDEYRIKRNGDPTYYGLVNFAVGDYWFYMSGVNPTTIVDTADTSLISHLNATSKKVYRVNGNASPYSDIIISQIQKKNTTSSWTDISLDTSDVFDTACEYRYKRNVDPTFLSRTSSS